jgi:transcriptional regulator
MQGQEGTIKLISFHHNLVMRRVGLAQQEIASEVYTYPSQKSSAIVSCLM